MISLKIKRHYENVPIPKKAHISDSGIDLTLIKVIEKNKDVLFFDTGISVEPPESYYTEIFSRSSIYKSNFIMANGVGVIDPDYRGIIYMPMRYIGDKNPLDEAYQLIGTRVGQLIVKKQEPISIEVVSELSNTIRDQGGFGSTGS